MVTKTVPAAGAATADLRINLNTPVGAEIHFSSAAEVAEFASAMSDRVACSLALLTGAVHHVDGSHLIAALEGVADSAYQVQQAIGLLTRKVAA